MLGKTNQFNLTTRRHFLAQVQWMLESLESIPLALRLRDKFGGQGMVATLLCNRFTRRCDAQRRQFPRELQGTWPGSEDAL